MENTEIEKSKVSREEFPNKTNQGILLPILEMSDPYYPHSHLATSKFGGYYMLFFMYSIYFIIVYPLLNYLHGEELFGMAIIKLV